MSVSHDDDRRAHPSSVVARIGSHLPILARLNGYPRGTCTASAYIEIHLSRERCRI
jgi:hypothetical protein